MSAESALLYSPSSSPLWSPLSPDTTPISQYRRHINSKFNQSLKDSHDLHRWSVTKPHDFWIDMYEYCNIIPPLPPDTSRAYDDTLRMRDIPDFFPHHKLNYAENVLVHNTRRNPDAIALVGLREGHIDNPERITWAKLTSLVRNTRSALVQHGIKPGDVVAALMSNSIWIIVIFLASASIGAIFTSISPDMGAGGCVSRLQQVRPVLLFSDVDAAVRGKRKKLLQKVRSVLAALQKTQQDKGDELEYLPQVVWVPASHAPHLVEISPEETLFGMSLSEFSSKSDPSNELTYLRFPLSTPLVILYSSGTTGQPKCILSPHGSIINYKKVAYLHNSLGPQSTVFQYTSTSWVLFNIMNGHLSTGAKLICYDGGALYPDPGQMLKLLEKYHVTYWGTSPRYLLELEQSGILPASFDLNSLTMVTTTGATVTGHQMNWFYDVFLRRIHLSSVAGSTEIASSWIASNPAGPVHSNEMQMWALGMDCDVADTETGKSVSGDGVAGELVCRKPFPSMPSGLWGDTGNVKYRESYFERFEDGKGDYLDMWAQHDFTSVNPTTGGIQIHGRSDGVLNPSGIRFGSAEIYNIVEGPMFNSLIADALCVGRRRKSDSDEAVFLFLIMAKGHRLTQGMIREIRAAIQDFLSPRHIPKFIFEVDEIPYTINGKKVETVVKKIISGLDVEISSALRNPGSLTKYQQYAQVERVRSSKL